MVIWQVIQQTDLRLFNLLVLLNSTHYKAVYEQLAEHEQILTEFDNNCIRLKSYTLTDISKNTAEQPPNREKKNVQINLLPVQ